jgi:hypothetical protein
MSYNPFNQMLIIAKNQIDQKMAKFCIYHNANTENQLLGDCFSNLLNQGYV